MSEAKPSRNARVEYRGTGFKVSLALILLTAALLLVLAVQNTASVTVQFLAWEFDLPLFAVVLGALLLGVVLDELIGLVVRRQRRSRLAERAELHRLRSDQEAQRPPSDEEAPERPAPERPAPERAADPPAENGR